MKNPLKSLAAAGVVTATLLSLTSCSVLESVTTDRSHRVNEAGILLPKPWWEAKVTWTETDRISEITSLPKNIAYVADRDSGREFLMYSPEGKAIVRIGHPNEFPKKFPRRTLIDVDERFVDGRTYLTVIQRDEHRYVATGLDENGKQLFRKVELGRKDWTLPELDPITGAKYPEERLVTKGGRKEKVIHVIDGVEIRSVLDTTTNKQYVSGPGWEREIFRSGPKTSYLNTAGRYLCFSEVTDSSHKSQLIDVHTGNEAMVDNAITSCLNDTNGVVDSQIIKSRSTDVMSSAANKEGLNWALDEGDDASYIVIPGLGMGWSFPEKSGFLPYSFDPSGRVYGYFVIDGEFISGAMDVDDPNSLIVLKGNPRAPIAVTGGEIGVFPEASFSNLTLGMNGSSSSVKGAVFAVKNNSGAISRDSGEGAAK